MLQGQNALITIHPYTLCPSEAIDKATSPHQPPQSRSKLPTTRCYHFSPQSLSLPPFLQLQANIFTSVLYVNYFRRSCIVTTLYISYSIYPDSTRLPADNRSPDPQAPGMPPRNSFTSSFSASDANNEVVCPLRNHDGSNCRKRCSGVSTDIYKQSLNFIPLGLDGC